ncbi:MAG: type II toxin-antitoxin system RelE/ParE family toxin [Prevotella sp.]|nr:type II toxin-antitoxin system RelE/ParE family toxin [Prevotella sp.]MBQ3624841.1 type II toxin-antitoxin system RelE/ParE family toxin [Prevotella sp.]MBR1655534.1 type II toxin-antitoxin system RelE/ParE family toxin [Prevotella sp.]MBR3445426.1 type II toxin-antitoxin system RelE/ParE family toxin [Prevotella sp.]
MEIVFDKEYLRELFYEGKAKSKKYRFQPQVVRKYVQVVNILDAVEDVEDLYRYHSLHYEKLMGDKKGLESVRVDSRYRIEFKTSSHLSNKSVTICNIVELSNHYK